MPETPKTNSRWSENEVKLIINDYFAMLLAEIQNWSYDKTEHRNLLIPQLSDRSKGSVEFKHQNISAVQPNYRITLENCKGGLKRMLAIIKPIIFAEITKSLGKDE